MKSTSTQNLPAISGHTRNIILALSVAVFLLLAGNSLITQVVNKDCPAVAVRPIHDFSLDNFVNQTWYFHQEMSVIYQKERTMFCQRDTINRISADELAIVTNWNDGSIDGEKKEATMHASIVDLSQPSAMAVGPPLVPKMFRGPYWILATGSNDERGHTDSATDYDWAIISGGAPTKRGSVKGKCKTGTGVNNSGVWLMTRVPEVDGRVVELMRSVLDSYGYDLSVLRPVTQAGCDYSLP